MAFAKLSGSLLERRGALLTAMLEQRASEPNDIADAEEFVGPISVRAMVGRSGSAVRTDARDRQASPIGHFGLAVWGGLATTAFAIVLVMHLTGQTGPTTERSNPGQPRAAIAGNNAVGTGSTESAGFAPSAPPVQAMISVAIAAPAGKATTINRILEPAGEPQATVASARVASPTAPTTTDGAAAAAEPLPATAGVIVAPAPVIQSPRSLSATEVVALLDRGDGFFAAGDIASARLFYQHAAEAGDGAAALRLGEAFDPAFLERAHLGRVPGDVQKALFWYLRASDLGNGDAEILLKGLGFTGKR